MRPGQRCGTPCLEMRGRPGKLATAALDLSKGRDVQYGAAFALALADDSPRAQQLAERSGKSLSRGYVGPLQLSADISSVLAEPRSTAKAMELSQPAVL